MTKDCKQLKLMHLISAVECYGIVQLLPGHSLGMYWYGNHIFKQKIRIFGLIPEQIHEIRIC